MQTSVPETGTRAIASGKRSLALAVLALAVLALAVLALAVLALAVLAYTLAVFAYIQAMKY
jgi:hypothetical protein